MLGVKRNAVVVRTHQRIGTDDDIRQIGRGLRAFAMDNEILATGNRRRIVAVGMQPPGVRVERIIVVNLLVERNARIRTEQHQTAARRAVFAGHDVAELVTGGGGAGVEQALDVDAALALMLELEVIVKPFVPGKFAKRFPDAGQDGKVVLGIVNRFDAALPNLQERIRTTRRDLEVLKLHPRIRRQSEVGILHARGHLRIHRHDQLHVRVDVLDHAVSPLGVVDQVDVGRKNRLRRRRHVRFAGEDFAAFLGGVDDERAVAVIPIGGLFVLRVGMGFDVFAMRVGIQILLERIFAHPAFEARPGKLAALEQSRLVVPCPTMTTRAGLANVASEHERQIRRAVRLGSVEPVVDAFALMQRSRLDRRDVLGQPLDQFLWRARDFGNAVEVVVLEMNLVEAPGRSYFDFAAVGQLHLPVEIELGINTGFGERLTHHVACDGFGGIGFRIPHHIIAELLVLIVRDVLDLLARTIGGQGAGVVGEHFRGAQPLEIVFANEEWEIRELLYERFVIPLVINHQSRHAEPQCRVRGGTDRYPVIRLRGRRAVFGRDDDDLRPALHGFDEPMRVGHFVFHEILPVHDDELRVAEIVEVRLAVLQAMHPRMAGSLIAVPGVIRPDATRLGFLRFHAADVHVQQREGITQAIHAILAQHAQQAHAAAHLDSACACAAHVINHLLRITLRFEELHARFTAITCGDGLGSFRDIGERVVPRQALELIRAARIKLVFGFDLGGERGETVVRPTLPAAPHDRMLQPIRAVKDAVEGVALRAMAIAPSSGGVIAVEVRVVGDVVFLAKPHNDAIANVGSDAAIVRVIRRADPRELVVVGVLIAILLLPVAVGVVRERIAHILGRLLRLEETQRQELGGGEARTGEATALEEGAAGKIIVHSFAR